MRVVAGTARGLRIDAPAGRATRPTTDRVRESIFNALGSLDAVVERLVVDAFAGSGALGIEALSRGAAHCWFVESDRAALAVVRANLERLGLADRSTVVGGDALAVVGGLAADLALCDPPYAFDRWSELAGRLSCELLVAESDREPDLGEAWETIRCRAYGGTVVSFARKRDAHRRGDG